MYLMLLNQYLLDIMINLIPNKELMQMMIEDIHEIWLDIVVEMKKEEYQEIFVFDHWH
jgi:hypothetical protein